MGGGCRNSLLRVTAIKLHLLVYFYRIKKDFKGKFYTYYD
jgi:hypothetical protein